MSTRSDKTQQVLLEPQDALYAYLDALLQEVPEHHKAPVNLVVEPEQQAVEAKPTGPVTAEPEAVIEQPEIAVAEAEPIITAEPEPVSKAEPVARQQVQTPVWGQQRFQSLMFSVTGLHLSVPLDKLNGVVPWEGDKVKPMPGHSAAFLGLYRHLGQNVKVIDLTRIVVPPAKQVDLKPADERVKHILLVDGGRWGLACDSINEIMELEPEDVRWRSSASKRSWLAGTVIDRLCALLELDALVKMLETGKEQA